MNSYLKMIMNIILALGLLSCGGQDKKNPSALHRYEVSPQLLHKTLHFTGNVQPLNESRG